MSVWKDFGSAEDQQTFDVIPRGTIARVRMTIKPGGYNDPDQGWTGGYATLGDTGAVYLNCEFVITEGPFARRKVWSLIGLHSPKGPTYANMGRSLIKGILNSARGFSTKDDSPQAMAARRINGIGDLDGIEFTARIDIEKDRNGDDKNVIKTAVTKDHKDFGKSGGNGGGSTPPVQTPPAAAPAANLPLLGAVRCGMLLRPRQKELVARTVAALDKHGNTLAVAPTGAGKTIMLSAIIGEMFRHKSGKACVLAHRDELTFQNEDKFRRVNPGISTGVFDASVKSWRGDVTFAMVQTLSRENNLSAMPPMDVLVIDEAHHARADSYMRVIERVKAANKGVKLLGMTATPNRGDKKGLRPVFSNVSDQITVRELIASGHLVPPRTFVMDVGVQDELRQVKKTASDFDMGAVSAIANTRPINNAVVKHWHEKAGDRKTVVFCSTIEHAEAVAGSFNAAGIPTVFVHGQMSDSEREAVLSEYTDGDAQVIVNVAVLTEGWDHPPTSCVVLLRPSSYKSTMIQMIGRGLRTVDPAEHPDIIKKDCIVLDFGTSTLLHGSLEQDVNLDDQIGDGEAPFKECPECGAEVPAAVKECPLCGYEWQAQVAAKELAENGFVMAEIDLLKRSSFLWVDLQQNDRYFLATGFNAWGGVFFKDGEWHAVGGMKNHPPRLLAAGERIVCFAAADDWLNTNETDESAHKTRSWVHQPATDKQLQWLPDHRNDFGMTRYKASALMTARFNRDGIQRAIESARGHA